ncbi:armadillo-type protein [Kickxella alabastrina]|uniref:armadillo-type protein n=1 Tax=Kickxella alabastrina TaxID=61397 RepID=UPI00221F0F61|nr:armadillo-type protein [Kickxella alabastrina]KAI7834504.1 armadillo-type protein [Kickxella alabastrina]
MSNKRTLSEAGIVSESASNTSANVNADNRAGSSGSVEPYTSYFEAHSVLVALKNTHSEDSVLIAGRRALLTAKTTTLPGAVQQVAVRLMAQLCAHPVIDSVRAVCGLVHALDAADESVRCEIYQTLATLHELKGIFASVPIPADTKIVLDAAILSDLNHSQHRLRCSSLAILPMVKPQDRHAIAVDVFDIVCKYTTDAHPKVRQTALYAILREYMMGVELPVEMYDECVVATKDDFEQVRLVAVELIWAISSAYPEYPVVIQKYKVSDSIRLLDDAFVKICDMVNDSSVVVRQRACTILGRFKNVDNKFLSQTFSKQVMSNLRRFVPRGGHSSGYRGRNTGVRGGKSRGFIPTPQGDADVESEEFRLLDSGAAGAFVHGLEDEYQEVRDAAIESITELSIASTGFAAKSVDFLVDMFNDSSDRVRLCAIRALVAIGERALIRLTDEQLSIVLSAMKDSSHIMREGIYAFLAVSTLTKSDCLAQLMAAFKVSLDKYSEDQMHIYRVLGALGRNHSEMIDSAFVRSLLGISEHYLSREARIDDIIYAGNVILIFNTSRTNRQRLASVLPDYVYNHLPYLRDKYRDCLPGNVAESVPERLGFVRQMLERPHVDKSVARLSLEACQHLASASFASIQEALALVCIAPNNPSLFAGDGPSSRMESSEATLKRHIKEFGQLGRDIKETDMSVHHSRQAVVHYARIVSDMLRAQQLADNMLQRPAILELTSSIMYGSYEIEARTLGLDLDSRLALIYIRLFAHACWINAHQMSQYDPRLVEKIYEEFVQRIRRMESLAQGRSASISGLISLAQHVREHTVARQGIQQFVIRFKPLLFAPATGRCQHASARISKTAVARRTIEFNHLFPLNLQMHASLSWVAHQHNVLVTVSLPTQTVVSFRPPVGTLKPLSPMHWQLEWDSVPVSLPLGSGESTAVTLAVALQQRADSPWSDAFIVRGDSVPVAYKPEAYYKAMAGNAMRYVNVKIVDEGYSVSLNPVEFRPVASAHTRA